MPSGGGQKIKISVGLSPRVVTAIEAEAKRMGITFADKLRRITDNWADGLLQPHIKPPAKVLVLDREVGSCRPELSFRLGRQGRGDV